MDLDKNFWDERYQSGDTGWDAGQITTPIKEYFDQVKDQNCKILIPGCGYGHEAEYLWKHGFKNLYVLDISEIPLQSLKNRISEFPDEQLIKQDFFKLTPGDYDIIVEQTFFCALDPKLRTEYVRQMAALLKIGGRLVGVLFDDLLNSDKPPFGGTKDEYIPYFRPYFEIKHFDKCYNSIPPRSGREFFINLIKK